MKLKDVAFRDLFERYVFLDCDWDDLGIDEEEWPPAAVAMMAFVSFGHSIRDDAEMLDLIDLIPVGPEYLEYLKRPSVQEWLGRGFSRLVCLDEQLAGRVDVLGIADAVSQEAIDALLPSKPRSWIAGGTRQVLEARELDPVRGFGSPVTFEVLVDCGLRGMVPAKVRLEKRSGDTFSGRLLDMLDDGIEVYENDELTVRIDGEGEGGKPILVGTKIPYEKPARNISITPDERAALELWTNGLGNSAKRFAGEDPMPPKRKKATRDSWRIREMPYRHESFYLGLEITEAEKRVLEYGHIPNAMEDHWFMYFADGTIHYHRSWTGYCMFEAKVEPCDDHFVVSEACVNRYPGHYKGTDLEYDKYLLARLIMSEIGR